MQLLISDITTVSKCICSTTHSKKNPWASI